MATASGLLLMLFGIGIAAVAVQSLGTGWLPCGPKGSSGRLEFRRDSQPVLYWLMFAVYGGGGVALVVYGLRVLLGHAEPPPLN